MEFAGLQKLNRWFEQNPLRYAQLKDQGKKVMGLYCGYTPGELAVAAGAVPVMLCGTRQDFIPAAETVLPRNLCPLIKSSYGFLLKDACPYLAASDLVVCETTCDGKKKMFEIMAEQVNMLVLKLPHSQDAASMPVWVRQLEVMADRIETDLGGKITEESLRDAIDLMNRERDALKRMQEALRHKPSPITGMQLVELAFKTSFFTDKEEGIAMIHEIADELEDRTANGISPYTEDSPRILVTGVPIGMGSHKIVKILDECGASVVCLDNCIGHKKIRGNIECSPTATKQEMLVAMANRYLDVPCSIMTPNTGRYTSIGTLARNFQVDAVVDLTWQACHTYNVEAINIKKFVTGELGMPSLHLETDYSESDAEQMRVRIDAFLEMVRP